VPPFEMAEHAADMSSSAVHSANRLDRRWQAK
jgi:hypothetical protein